MGLRFSEKPSPNDDTLRDALTTVGLDKKLEDNASLYQVGKNKGLLSLALYSWIRPSIY